MSRYADKKRSTPSCEIPECPLDGIRIIVRAGRLGWYCSFHSGELQPGRKK